MMDVGQVTPGHFTLPLSINRKKVDSKRLEYKERFLNCLLREKGDRPERHAIRNLLGLLAARMEQYDKAMGYFMKVTSEGEDICNLNAYANIKSVCEFQYRFREAASNESKLKEYLNLAIAEDGEALLSLQSESRKIHARCIAEQAYAIAFDLNDMEKYQGQRYRRAYDLFNAALEMGQVDVSLHEREDWEYNLALVCYNIGAAMKNNFEEREKWKPYLKKSFDGFFKTCQIEDTRMAAESWSYIGEILNLCSLSNVSVSDWFDQDENLARYLENPEECMCKAQHIEPKRATVYFRHARLLRNSSLDMALELIDKAVDLADNPALKREAYLYRGQLLKTKYIKQTDKYRALLYKCSDKEGDFEDEEQLQEMVQDQNVHRELLHRAKGDFETALQIATQPRELAALGETWHLLAKDEIGELLSTPGEEAYDLVEDNLNKSLMYFTQATHCMDGALNPRINYMRGLCLFDAEEKEAALESFKQAMECQPKGNRSIDVFAWLIQVYLSLIEDNIQDLNYQRRILSEMVYWSEIAITDYGAHDVREYILSSEQWSDMPQAVDIFVEFCKTTDHPKADFVFSAAKSRKMRLRERHKMQPKFRRARTPSPPENRTTKPPTPISAPAKITDKPSFGVLIEDGQDATPRRPTKHVNHTALSGSGDANHKVVNGSGERFGIVELNASSIPETLNMPLSDTILTSIESLPAQNDQLVSVDELRMDEIVEPPDKARFEGHKYDFFVIYDSSNASTEWVEYNLLPRLERTQLLKGCIKERDFIPGRYVVENYTSCIQESAVVLLIITKDFEKTPECRTYMNYALTPEKAMPVKPVIPIMREACTLPLTLRHITPFDATRVVNWNQLYDAIECLVNTDGDN